MKLTKRGRRLIVLMVALVGMISLQSCQLCEHTGICKSDTKTSPMKEGKKESPVGKVPCCPDEKVDVKLEYLAPIAVGITAGCASCAERFIEQAIKNGCSEKKVEEVISIVESIHQLDCFRKAVGKEVVDRMKQPLEVSRKILQEGKKEGSAGKVPCCPSEKMGELEYLIPIAVGITAGCANCTEKFIEQAIKNGCSEKKVEEAISIVESIHQLECFREAVGQEIVNRMKESIKVGRETLKKIK